MLALSDMIRAPLGFAHGTVLAHRCRVTFRIWPRWLALAAALIDPPGAVARVAGPDDPCTPPGPGRAAPSRDLYCIELFPTGAADSARGTAALEWVAGPFTVAVARDGTQQFAVAFDLAGLPPLPRGPRPGYVAWAAPPLMDPLIRLGTVRDGRTAAGIVALDRFVILVSAEPDTLSPTRRGALLLRGESASNRLRPPDLFQFAIGLTGGTPADPHMHHHGPADSMGWTDVPMPPGLTMLQAEMALRPGTAAWFPPDTDAPPVTSSRVVHLANGDTLDLVAGLVRRTLAGRPYTMFAFNGQQPGPLLRTDRGTEVVVRFTNRLPLPSTIHWHGLRLDAAFDGVPGLSQQPVPPGGTFIYHLRFPDAGLYWYHPHVREDLEQDLGLYGNIFVQPGTPDPWGAADQEDYLMLDDLLVNEAGPVPYGRDTPTHAAMGRFGNRFLVNGEPGWIREIRPGETLRMFLTNAANARTFNLGFDPDARLVLRAADQGSYGEPVPVDHVVLGPAERYVVDARFPRPGTYALVNRVRALDHLYGRFFGQTDTLGWVTVRGRPVRAKAGGGTRTAVRAEIAGYLARAEKAESRTLELRVGFTGLPFISQRLMRLDSLYFMPVEWAGTMVGMNWATVGTQAHWTLRDPATGRENDAIGWRFQRGTLLRLRLVGARDVLHAMQHPIHLHGQRFLVLAVGGVPNHHPAWKDTVLVPAGGTVDLLVDLDNPGRWMLHCHIAEHLEAGMMTTLDVTEE
jgi:FtsP/CotA-like multicopper oxidase with cupredoxin domain